MKYLFSKSALPLRRNSLWLLLARVSTQGLAVIFVVLVARRLSAAGFGQFAFIGTVLFIGNVFTSFGTDTLLIREIAKAGNVTTLARRAFTLQLILSALWCLTALVLHVDFPLLIYTFSLFPLALFSVASALLRAFERMDLFWGLSLINGAIQITSALFSSDLLTLCMLLLIGNLITAGLAFWICSAMLPSFILLPLLDFRPLLSLTLPFAALATFSILSQRLGVLVIFHFAGDVATGLFASATRIVDGLKIGHYAILGVLLPVLSRQAQNSKQAYRATFWMLLGLSALLAGTVGFLAEPILALLFGEKYITATDFLRILIWSLVPYTISAFVSVDLVASNEEMKLLKVTLISLLVACVLFIWLIIKFGIVGAAWAALSSEIVQALILLYAAPASLRAITKTGYSNLENTHDFSR